MDMKIAQRQFSNHRHHTKGRTDALGTPIKFLLTFSEWVDIWGASGKYEQRGNKLGQYVMSRHNDIGHYEIGNVAIKLHGDNVSEAQKGKNHYMYGKNHTEETRAKMSAAKMGVPMSAEHKEKISATLKGVPKTAETREKMSVAKKGLPKITCPHCQFEGGVGGMKRWHFDNCKQKGRNK